MRPRSEVTLHLTREQWTELQILLAGGHDSTVILASPGLRDALANAEFDPLLDERVIVGSSFKRGQG